MVLSGVCLVYSCLAWLAGRSIEARMTALPYARAPYITVVEDRYRRGWFASDQDLILRLGPGAAPGGLRIKVHNVIRHGPICGVSCLGLALIESQVLTDGDFGASVVRLYGNVPPVVARTRLGFLGGGTATIAIKPLKEAMLSGGTRVDWDGMRIEIGFTRDGDTLTIHGLAPHLVWDDVGGGRLEVSGIAVDSSNHRIRQSLFAGATHVVVDRIAGKGAGAVPATTIHDITYTVTSSADAGFMNTGLALDSGSVEAPGAGLAGVHCDLTLRHLQMDALEALNAAAQEANARTPADPGVALSALQEPLRQLLLHQPDIHVDRVGVATAGGQVLLTGVIGLPGIAAADLAQGARPVLLSKLNADLEFSADDAALEQLPLAGAAMAQQLPAMARQGFVTHEGGRWRSHLHYETGVLTADGKAFPGRPPPSGAH